MSCYLGAPEEPEFEDVVVSSALDHLVARVEAGVVVFVLLKQVLGAHLVAVHQQTLQTESVVCWTLIEYRGVPTERSRGSRHALFFKTAGVDPPEIWNFP